MKHHNKRDNSTLWVVIASVVFLMLLIAGLSLAGKKDQNRGEQDTSRLEAAESSYDFGTISMAKGKVTKIFVLKNNTSEAIMAEKLYTSCMCTQATLLKADERFGPFSMPAHGKIPEINESIGPGQEVGIEIIFDPAAHGPAGVGPIEREVTLETSDGRFKLKFKAQVAP